MVIIASTYLHKNILMQCYCKLNYYVKIYNIFEVIEILYLVNSNIMNKSPEVTVKLITKESLDNYDVHGYKGIKICKY